MAFEGEFVQAICAGTLVGPQRVVTAGHCVSGSSASDVFVIANKKELFGDEFIGVSATELAPSYAPGTATDVAILTLVDAPVPATTIDTLAATEAAEFPAGASAQIAGWGSITGLEESTYYLQQGTVTLEATCGAPGIRCSVTPTEPCSGDSGDPAIVQLGADTVSKDPSPANGTWRLVGIVVGGSSDCTFGAYADLTEPAMRAFVGSSLDDPPVIPVSAATPPPPAARSFPPPQTKLLKAQINPKQGSATFKFKGLGNLRGFQCALASSRQKPKFKACRSPKRYKNLAPGTYTFKVRALGPGGTDGSPAKKRFTLR
jgi:hypothetical protein